MENVDIDNIMESYENMEEQLEKKRKIEDITNTMVFMSNECNVLNKKIKANLDKISSYL